MDRINVPRAAGDLDDLDAQLVSEDARIGEERLVALVGVQVGAADADAVHAHQRFAGPRGTRDRPIDDRELPRLVENDRLHHSGNCFFFGSLNDRSTASLTSVETG